MLDICEVVYAKESQPNKHFSNLSQKSSKREFSGKPFKVTGILVNLPYPHLL